MGVVVFDDINGLQDADGDQGSELFLTRSQREGLQFEVDVLEDPVVIDVAETGFLFEWLEDFIRLQGADSPGEFELLVRLQEVDGVELGDDLVLFLELLLHLLSLKFLLLFLLGLFFILFFIFFVLLGGGLVVHDLLRHIVEQQFDAFRQVDGLALDLPLRFRDPVVFLFD